MLPAIVDPDRRFALLHVSKRAREAVHALWALDETLGQIVAGTRDLFVGQMRLTWWHEALTTLEPGARRGQPVLDALADVDSLDGSTLATLVEGWEALLEPLPLTADTLETFAAGRGRALFDATTLVAGGGTPSAAGEGWALVDFARKCSDDETAARAWSLAAPRLASIHGDLGRPLLVLARLAHADAEARRHVPRTAWRLLRALS